MLFLRQAQFIFWNERKLSHVWLAIPRTIARQAPLYMGFSRQEYWSGLPFPSPGELPNPGIEPRASTLQADALPTELLRKPWKKISIFKMNAFTISKLDFQKKREYCGLGLCEVKHHEIDSGLGWRSSSPWCMKGQQLLIINQLHQVALVIKNPPVNAGDIRDTGLIPVLGRSPGRGHGNPL